MVIRRRTDRMRAATPTNRTGPAGRPRTAGIIKRWKEQLAAGKDLTETSEPSIDDENCGRFPPRSRDGNDVHGLSDLEVLISLVILGLVCVGGYFLLMKLVEISRQEDCLLGGGRSCVRLQLPPDR
jgi:hypothetical protein